MTTSFVVLQIQEVQKTSIDTVCELLPMFGIDYFELPSLSLIHKIFSFLLLYELFVY